MSDPSDHPEPALDAGLEPESASPAQGPTDHELIRAAQRGEEAGFEGLVRRHEDRAMRVAWGLVANREDARDLAQEAFLRVFRNLDRFDFQHEFTTWLFRIVTNLAIDHLRKRRPQRSTVIAGEEGETEIDLPDEDSEQPYDAMSREETAARVRACIDRLAPHFRSVMVLRELEGLPCTEIAEIVGATHVTVRWRLHRGRKLFQDEWERQERAARRPGWDAAGTWLPQEETESEDSASNTSGEPPVQGREDVGGPATGLAGPPHHQG